MNLKSLKKNWHIYALAIIMIAAFFVRSYHFEDFLLFRADQARDIFYVQAVQEEGIGELRLLGPSFGGRVTIEGKEDSGTDFFYLGPIYYYFQTLSAFIFQEVSPSVMAYPDFLFSLLSIPLFFLLLSQFFSKKVSILTTIVFAFSFVLLQYSRFAWNVNQLIFWEILLALSMLRANFSKNRKKAGLWMISASISVTVLMQLHPLSALGFLVIASIFLIKYKPKISIRAWAVVLFAALLLLSPVIASEIKNNGDNARRFLVSFNNEEGSDDILSKKIAKMYEREGEFFALAVTSVNGNSVENIKFWGTIFIAGAFLLLIFSFKEANKKRRAFIVLIFLWFFVFLLIFWKIIPRLSKIRYWLSVAPLAFIFLAVIFNFLEEKFKKKGILISAFAVVLLVALNFQAIIYLYSSLENGEKGEIFMRTKPTIRIYRELISFGAIEETVDFVTKEAKSQKKALCYKTISSQTSRPVNFILTSKYSNLKAQEGLERANNDNCVFFVITNLDRDEDSVLEVGNDKFRIVDSKRFRGLIAWELELKKDENKQRIEENLDLLPNYWEQKKSTINERIGGRAITWGDVCK